MYDGILQGLATAFQPINLLLVLSGCFAGTFIGMLPGLGPVSAIALMIPITYGFDPASGLILMAGVYYGAIFGGSTSAILINAPGVSGAVATAFDGYPLAQKGQAGKALALAAYSSFSGGTIGAMLLCGGVFFAQMGLEKFTLDRCVLPVSFDVNLEIGERPRFRHTVELLQSGDLRFRDVGNLAFIGI